MFAAVISTPPMATPGRPIPTGVSGASSSDFTSRRTSRPIDALTRSGVDGIGVGTRSRSETSSPVEVSTTAALMPLPPTSTPTARGPRAAGSMAASVDALSGRSSVDAPSGGSSVIRRPSEVIDGDPAVDDKRRSVGPARLVRREVDRHVHDLLGLPEATRRVPRQTYPLGLVVLDQPVHQEWRLDGARADRVGTDALWPELDRKAPGQAEHSALRGGVRILGHRAADQRDEARDVDDRSAAGDLHRRDGVLAAQEHAADVDRHDLVPDVDRRVGHGMVRLRHDARVVVQDVEPAIRPNGVVDHLLRVGLVRHVRLHERRLPAGRRDLVHGLAPGRLAELRDHDLRALLGEHPGRDAAHPTTAPGDDRNLVRESHPGWSSLLRASYPRAVRWSRLRGWPAPRT